MIPINERTKSCADGILKKLEAFNSKRKHSPLILESEKPRLPQRSRWEIPLYDPSAAAISPSCCNCATSRKTISDLRDHVLSLQRDLNSLSAENADLRQKLSQAEEVRKILHSQLLETRGPIRVCCRVKPAVNKCVELPDAAFGRAQTITVSKAGTRNSYVFDRVFTEDSQQVDVFEEFKAYVQTAVDGGQVCFFSYGQTGSGKTYTLEGKEANGEITEQSGILPRAAVLIFKEINRQHLNNIQVYISCVEVYMDIVSDLLSDTKTVLKNSKDQVCWLPAGSISELLSIISTASQRRITRETHQNTSSSRGHTVYQIRINSSTAELRGLLSVIDLAGSERATPETFTDKTPEVVESMRTIQEEAKYINKSLSCLRRVFESLSGKNTGTVPPYRETKLTKLLQEPLQSGKVVVVVTVSPDNYAETKESLKFGATVQNARPG
jgi:hypothetical protein